MAVSPYDPPPGSAGVNSVAAKARALTLLNAKSPNGNASPSSRTASKAAAPPAATAAAADDSAIDLSEELNRQTRDKYEKGKKLGEGTYAIVYKGHVKTDPSQLVAIKKIKVQTEYRDGLSMDAIREVKYLQELAHPNIIALHSVYSSKNQNLNLVLEFLPLGDLEMLIKDTANINYGNADIKAWMGMLARGVWFCHANFVLHRDIKPNNLLIAADGEVKLADFGLARSFADPYTPMSHNVITRWYRPPELFYKARHYSGAVDVWSMGTVFAELVIRHPFMPGNSDLEQINLICQAIGTPTEDNWPGVSKLDDYVAPAKDAIVPVQGRMYYMGLFGNVGQAGVDLLMKMLTLDPRRRISAREVLEHEWWTTEPRPTKKEDLPRKGGGEAKIGEDLKRRGGELEERRGDKVARKLDFGGM
jgi:cyclin-dependent kinase 7